MNDKLSPKVKRMGAAVMLLMALAILLIGDPTLADRLKEAEPEVEQILSSRARHVDPWEVYEGMHNNQMKLVLLDLRDTKDFNLFHLHGAKRVTLETLGSYPITSTVVILMSNDEAKAEEAWRRMYVKGQKNAYIMAGGINLWLSIFRPEIYEVFGGDPDLWLFDMMHLTPHDGYGHHPHFNVHAKRETEGLDETLRHFFLHARGAAPAWSAPPLLHGEGHAHARHFEKKIKLIGAVAKKAGGCG